MNNTIIKLDLTDIYRVFHPTTAKYLFFSSAHRTLTKLDNISVHKKKVSVNFKRLKSFKILSPNTIEKNKKSITEVKLETSPIWGNYTMHFQTTNGSKKKLQGKLNT